MKGARVKIARRQNCIRGLNCKKKNEGLILHEDTYPRRQIFTRGQSCTKKILHRGSILHE